MLTLKITRPLTWYHAMKYGIQIFQSQCCLYGQLSYNFRHSSHYNFRVTPINGSTLKTHFNVLLKNHNFFFAEFKAVQELDFQLYNLINLTKLTFMLFLVCKFHSTAFFLGNLAASGISSFNPSQTFITGVSA